MRVLKIIIGAVVELLLLLFTILFLLLKNHK